MNTGKKTPLEIILITLIGALLLSPLAFVFTKRQANKDRQECFINMWQLSGAIRSWSLENKKLAGETVKTNVIALYLKNSAIPVCLSGGTYQMRVGTDSCGDVSCSAHGPVR